MASFQFKDICYPSEQLALEAFNVQFISNSFNTLESVFGSSVNSSGLITYSYRLASGTTKTGLTYQLPNCEVLKTSFIFDKMPVQDMIFAAALVLVFILGINQGAKS